MTNRRHLKQKLEEDESDDEIKFSKKELLAPLKAKNLRKLTNRVKKKRDKEEDSEESHEATSKMKKKKKRSKKKKNMKCE